MFEPPPELLEENSVYFLIEYYSAGDSEESKIYLTASDGAYNLMKFGVS